MMHRRAFTLIELLVVVAIIGLLIALLLPGMTAARAQARQTACAANLHQVGVGLYNYWTEWDGRVPYIVSPMTNTGFGNLSKPDAEVDPFDRLKWPMSLPSVLMPTHMGEDTRVFNCPSAINGWPREGGFRYSYREAAINQPNGAITPLGSYERETFGFMDGRILRKLRPDYVAEPKTTMDYVKNAQAEAMARGTFLRDMIQMRTPGAPGDVVLGPHRGGIQVLNRDLHVERRDRRTTTEDLAPNGQGSKF